ncbi:MAG: DUF58 domain-containing protein [Verrucomicrobiota bacterium]|nr:DUF58 domain-containing protein [Verrucomicrobiota bacterium]
MATSESKEGGLIDPRVTARLAVQPLVARFAMEGSVSGMHRSPHRGSSVEFAEYRQYVPGDDLRRLDWRVLGRTDRYYLKEYEAETNLRCYFVLDCSGSMNFTSAETSKLDYAIKLIAHLAYQIIHQGDAAGLVTVGPKVITELPPKRMPSHLQLIMDILKQAKGKGETGLIETLHELADKARRRALVLIFSDCFTDIEPLIGGLQHLRFQKHDVGLFHILDRQEMDFNFDRPIRFADLESSFSMVTEPAMVREAYLEQFQNFQAALQKGCHECNSDYREVTTSKPFEKVLADFLVDRAKALAFR